MMIDVLSSLQSNLAFELQQLLDILQIVSEDHHATKVEISELNRLHCNQQFPENKASFDLQAMPYLDSNTMSEFERCTVPMTTSGLSRMELIHLYNQEKERGLIKVDFDPTTQRRRDLIANRQAAVLWGMSDLDLLTRLARYDLPAPYCETDWLASCVMDIRTHFDIDSTQYLRMYFPAAGAVVARLVERIAAKTFAASGGLREARPASSGCSPPFKVSNPA